MSNCLCCGYSLACLPESHQCPECGLAFHPGSFAVEAKPPQFLYTTILSLFGWGAMGFVIVGSSGNIKLGVLLAAFWLATVVYQLLVGRHGQRLIVDQHGIHVSGQGRISQTIPWEEITGFKNSWVDGGLLARCKNGASISLCRDPKVAKACRKDIEAAWIEFSQRQQGHSGTDLA